MGLVTSLTRGPGGGAGADVCRDDGSREHLCAVHFFEAAKKKGVKPDSGCELYITRTKPSDRPYGGEGDENNHLLGAGGERRGYRNLIRITSEASLHGFLSQAAREQTVFGGALAGA